MPPLGAGHQASPLFALFQEVGLSDTDCVSVGRQWPHFVASLWGWSLPAKEQAANPSEPLSSMRPWRLLGQPGPWPLGLPITPPGLLRWWPARNPAPVREARGRLLRPVPSLKGEWRFTCQVGRIGHLAESEHVVVFRGLYAECLAGV